MIKSSYTIRKGIPVEHRKKAAQLFSLAFEQKFIRIIGSAVSTSELLSPFLNLNNAFCAISHDNQLAGLAGFQYHGSSFTNIPFKALLQKYSLWKAVQKYLLMAVIFHRKPDNKYQLLMDGIVVSEKHRGTGIGTKLFDALEGFARENNMHGIRLDVIDENPKAKQLYERLGFQAVKHTISPKFVFKLTGVGGSTTMVKRL